MTRMLSLVKRPAPSSQAWLAGAMLQHVVIQILHRLGPGRLLNRASAGESEILLEAAKGYQQLAEIYYFANERILTVNAGLHVLNLSERARQSPIRARAYANMAVICGLIPLHGAARSYSRQALATAEEVGDRSALAWANLLVGTYEIGLGHWEYGAQLAQRSVDLCRELGDLRQLGLSLGLLALPAIYRADFAMSNDLYVEWYDVAVQADNIQHQAFGLFGQAESLLPGDRAAEAAQLAEKGVRLLIERTKRTVDNRTAEIRGYGLLALARQREGQDELAAEAAGAALEVLNQLSLPTRVTLLEGLSGVAETYLMLWANDTGPGSAAAPEGGSSRWREPARQGCDFLGQFGKVFDMGRPRAHLWWGMYHWLDGEQEKARQSWEESQAEAERLEMPVDTAVARLYLARLSRGEERRTMLAEAMKCFEEAGATYYLNHFREIVEDYPEAGMNTGPTD